MYRRRGSALVAVLGLVCGASVAVMPAAIAGESASPALRWAACPADVVFPPPTQAQCARLRVPLDYSDPDGTQIEIMISKVASTNPAKRRGVLLLNPGGPSRGLDQPGFLVNRGLPASVLDSYDLIGMDPRGIGHSSPVSCGFTLEDPYWANLPPYAVDDAAVVRQAAVAKRVAEKCAANDEEGRLRHLSTANTARDLDRVRAALGEKTANFYGASWGSALGAAYASMFPMTVDRVVLDSNVGDTHLDRAGMRLHGQGFEQTFPDFAKWAATRHESYRLGRTPAEVRKTYFAIAERLDKAPAADGTDGAVFRYLTFYGLYSEMLYGNTARMWQSHLNPGPPTAATAAMTPNPADNAFSAFLAFTCNDSDWPEDVVTYRRAVAEDRKRFPMYGAASANIIPCAYWKHEPAEPSVKVNDNGPVNILILQNRRDPVTPYAGGTLLREKFEKRSRLVSVNESGHGVYLTHTNACALDITTTYLVDGKLPARDVSCRRS